MAREVIIDFTGAPPAQGSTGSDHMPAGKYLFEVKTVVQKQAGTGADMISGTFHVVSGPAESNAVGKRIVDNWVLPAEGKSKFGLQRFHAFLIAIGSKEASGKVKLDLDKFTGKRFVGEVRDEVIPANGNYPERLTSRIDTYSAVPAAAPKAAAAAPKAAPAPAPAPVAEPEPEVAELVDDTVTEAVDDADVAAVEDIFA